MTIEQNQPYSMEFQNFRRVHRNRAIGELFAVELEITEEDWHYLSAFPQDAIGQVAIQWSDRAGAPEKPKREAKPKGEHGAFWAKMVKSSAYDCRDLQAWLEVGSREEVHEALRAAFGVESLTFVSPREAVAKFEMALLSGVAAIARRLGESEGTNAAKNIN